jgi:Mn-containing catalase
MLIFVVISFIYTTDIFGCILIPLLEQKARATYEKLIDLCKDDADVVDVLRFLRQREIVHFQRFGEALRVVQDKLAEKNYYMNDCCKNNTNSFECTNTFNSVNNY